MLNTFNMIYSMNTLSSMNIEESSSVLQHFRENYYEDATLFSHMPYIRELHEHYKYYGEFPSKNEFYLRFRNCFCIYSVQVTDEMFIRASDFFMKTIGDILKLSCEDYYNFSQFVMIEHRNPATIHEFIAYVRRLVIAEVNPESLFQNDIVLRPVDPTKIEELKKAVQTIENESCGICQDNIQNQQAIKLDCGHYFHFNENDCCGTVFKWFETNNNCPICRKEI